MNLLERAKEFVANYELRRGGARPACTKLTDDLIAVMDEWYDQQPSMYLSEVREKLRVEKGIDASTSALSRFLVHKCDLTVKTLSKTLPQQAAKQKTMAVRTKFVEKWFDPRSVDWQLLGTNKEFGDIRQWRMKRGGDAMVSSVDQLFFVDETGCNKHTVLRTRGRSKRGTPAYAKTGSFDADRGQNVSCIIGIGAHQGVVGVELLQGKVQKFKQLDNGKVKRKRSGTNRQDFCRFLKEKMGPAMLASARASGLSSRAPLYLMMDNASIHKGKMVSDALRSVSKRLHVAYQAPYMPHVHPTELVNNQLKQKLRRHGCLRENEKLQDLIRKALSEVTADSVQGYYRLCGWK